MRGAIFFFLFFFICSLLAVSCITDGSWYVLYLFVRFSLGLLSTCCVTTGWIFEICLCEDNSKFKKRNRKGLGSSGST